MRRVWQSLIAVGLVVGLECGAQEIPDQELLEAVLTDLQPGTRWRSFEQMKSVGMRKTKYVGIEQGAAMYCYPVKLPGYAGRECIAAVLKGKPAVIDEVLLTLHHTKFADFEKLGLKFVEVHYRKVSCTDGTSQLVKDPQGDRSMFEDAEKRVRLNPYETTPGFRLIFERSLRWDQATGARMKRCLDKRRAWRAEANHANP